MTESLAARADRYLAQHVIPRDRPRPARPCAILNCDREDTRPYLRGPLCPDHAPPAPLHLPSPHPSPSDTMPPRIYGTATTDPRPGR